MKPEKGGQLARSAGSYAQLMGKEGNYAQLRLPSGEMRVVLLDLSLIHIYSSPRATLTAGEVCTTTYFFGSASAFHTFLV